MSGSIRAWPALLAVVATVAVGCSGSTRTSAATTTATTSSTSAAPLSESDRLKGQVTPVGKVLVGMCFNPVPDPEQRPFAVLVIGCENPHIYEAFATPTLRSNGRSPTATTTTAVASPATVGTINTTTTTAAVPRDPSGYPGVVAVRDDAESQCVSAFQPWMGREWTKSEYDIQSWWPSPQSWPRGDRAILCAAYRLAGGTTKGSVRGTGR